MLIMASQQSLVNDLKPSIGFLTDILQQLRVHTASCKSTGEVLDKTVVMPLFRHMASVQVFVRVGGASNT